MGDRFNRSLTLTKQSLAVLKGNPQLALFPIVSSIVSFFVFASFAVPAGIYLNGHDLEKVSPYLYYSVMFAFYFVSYFVVIFFNAGLISSTRSIMEGRPATFSDGLRDAGNRMGAILGWTLIAASVGMLLRMVSERSGLIGRIIVTLLGGAWTILTFFVVPVLVIDNKGPIQSIKESGVMLKNTWGERAIFGIGTRLIFGLLMILCVLPLGLAVYAAANHLWGVAIMGGSLGVLYILGLAIISSSVAGIYQTALYLYSRNGVVPPGFSPDLAQQAFKSPQGGSFYPRFK